MCKEEYQAFAEMILSTDGTPSDEELALKFVKYVDGKHIMPKLSSHIRAHRVDFDRSQCVRQCVANIKSGRECLEELNERIKPQDMYEENETSEQSISTSMSATASGLPQSSARAAALAPAGSSSALRCTVTTKPASTKTQLGKSHTWSQVRVANSLPLPKASGLHTQLYSNVGGTLVGTLPGYQPGPRAKHCKRCIECGGGYALASTCKGRGGKQHCQHFNAQGQSIIATKKRNSPTCQNCKAHGDIINCDSCPGRLGVSKCINHPLDGKIPQPRKKRKTNNVNCSM